MRTSLHDDERGAVGAERVAVWILVLLAIGLAVAVAGGPGTSLATNAPDASFEGSYDAETNTLQIEHAGGDDVTAGPTSALVVVVSDSDGEHARNVTWVGDGADGVANYSVSNGDGIAIDDATADGDDDGDAFDGDATVGFELDEGDEATVVWRGRPVGAPGETSVTLGTYRI